MSRVLKIPSWNIDATDALPFTHIIIHHSATVDSALHDWACIHNYHKNIKGWTTIGYNFGIERIGRKLTFHCGRPLSMPGAHTTQKNMNRKGIGFLYVGCFDNNPPDDEMIQFSIPFLCAIIYTFGMQIEDIRGHRDYAGYKTCPGRKFDITALQQAILESYYPRYVCPWHEEETPGTMV